MLTPSIITLALARWAAILNPQPPVEIDPPTIDQGATSITQVGGDILVQVKGSGEELYSLEIDHNAEGILPEFTLYADPDNVWGDPQSASQAAGAGVSASFTDGLWTLTIQDGGAAKNVFVDQLNGNIRLYVVVHNSEGGSSGSMNDGSYLTLELTITPEEPVEDEEPGDTEE